jgi:hypothetical protein
MLTEAAFPVSVDRGGGQTPEFHENHLEVDLQLNLHAVLAAKNEARISKLVSVNAASMLLCRVEKVANKNGRG